MKADMFIVGDRKNEESLVQHNRLSRVKKPALDVHGTVCVHSTQGTPTPCGKPVLHARGWLCEEHSKVVLGIDNGYSEQESE